MRKFTTSIYIIAEFHGGLTERGAKGWGDLARYKLNPLCVSLQYEYGNKVVRMRRKYAVTDGAPNRWEEMETSPAAVQLELFPGGSKPARSLGRTRLKR